MSDTRTAIVLAVMLAAAAGLTTPLNAQPDPRSLAGATVVDAGGLELGLVEGEEGGVVWVYLDFSAMGLVPDDGTLWKIGVGRDAAVDWGRAHYPNDFCEPPAILPQSNWSDPDLESRLVRRPVVRGYILVPDVSTLGLHPAQSYRDDDGHCVQEAAEILGYVGSPVDLWYYFTYPFSIRRN